MHGACNSLHCADRATSMTKNSPGGPTHPGAQAGDPLCDRRPRSARQSRLRQSAGLSCLDRALSERAGLPRPPQPLHLRPPRHADVGGARKRAARRSKGRNAPAWRCCPPGSRRFRSRCSRCSRPATTCWSPTASIGPTRKFCDGVLNALRHHDHLLRSADRRRHRRADAAQHARGVRRGAGLAVVRDAGRAGDRRRRRTHAAPSC